MFYNTEAIIAAAKRSEFFPVSQSTFTDPDDFIGMGNEELQLKILPLIMSVRQDYFLTHKVVALRNNVSRYAIPERAAGNAFSCLWFLPDSSDTETRYQIRKREKAEVTGSSVASSPSLFYIEGDEIILWPKPSSLTGSEAIMFDYFERPSELIETTSCAKITAVNTVSGTTTLTVDTDLTGSLSVGSKVDFLCNTSPFRLWAKDVAITAITSTTIAVLAADISDEGDAVEPVVNDYICPARYTNIPMIPQEMHPVLSEMICYRALKALGMNDKLQTCAQNIKDMASGALKLITNRVEADVDVVYDQGGFLSFVTSGVSNVASR